jgi:ABC-type nitrate/sulfonate/bicarbonate transport system substrate-binding protein
VIKNRPAAVKAFMNGYVKAISQIKSDPTKAVNIMAKTWQKDPGASQQAVNDVLPQLDQDGLIPAANLQGLGDSVSFLSDGSVDMQDPASLYVPWNTIG